MSQITETIKRLRAPPYDLSQSEIAKEVGVTQSCISRWEDGDVPAGANGALKLAAFAAKAFKQPRKQRTAAQAA